MFESAELGQRISKGEYDSRLPALRAALVQAHFALKGTQTPLIIIVSGADGAGKGELVHRLNEWLDPRGVDTHAFWQTSDEERERPPYWRFWRCLPSRGRVAILFGSWYTAPVIQRVYGRIRASDLDQELDRITTFERMLTDDHAVIVKLWFHLSKVEQGKQLKDLTRNPHTHWRVLPTDWKHFKLYDKFTKVSERAIRRTDTPNAPWHIIEATDRRHREMTSGQIILDAIQGALKPSVPRPVVSKKATPPPTKPATSSPALVTILDHVDLTQRLDRERYNTQLEKWQTRLARLIWAAWEKKRSSVAVFEGWDAAGKGSAIRRVTEAMDPRLYRIVPVAAPSDEERAHHYLWRFWRALPRAGCLTIFDRSWYGRVLVERIEGFAQEHEWKRAYSEINEFEEQLADHGIVLAKFWIHISKDEQLRRFKQREEIPFKQYKITPDDWRNRDKWDGYQEAVNEMVARTSTANSPWTLVSGNDKRFARIQVLKTFCHHLETVL